MNRRDAIVWSTALASSASRAAPTAAERGSNGNGDKKVLRYAFRIAETSFDPVAVTDLYSRTVIASILEAPLEYAFLARPVRTRPNTAAAMPSVSEDFKHFRFEIRPGIFFADDPAFKGRRRELVAEDYVFALKRHYDPRWKSGNLYLFENAGILGLSELRKRLQAENRPFDYDAPVEGIRATGRYSFEVRLANPTPRFLGNWADPSLLGAVAREVVERYGDKIGEHPVGTGPYRLALWKRSSRIVLRRNPGYREVLYDEEAPAGDERLGAVAREFKGRRLPLNDEVQISIIEENQPRWLAFLNEEHDLLEELPPEYTPIAIPNNRIAPNLARKGMGFVRYPRADISYSYFAMENPVVGGYSPAQVALRRAISLAVDVEREIRLVRRHQAIAGQSIVSPEVWGYDPALKTEMSEHSRARAMALLDLHGFVDKNGDGWRERPDGSPLVLEYATQPDQQSRQLIELWQKNMTAVGIRIEFKTAKWPENLKASRAGKLMMWGLGWSVASPDCDNFLGLGYGPNKGQSNHSRFDLPAYNRIYQAQRELPNGPERAALVRQAQRLLVAYMPYKVHVHRIFTDMTQPWVRGYSRNVFVREFWKYVDVDGAAQRGLGDAVA